MSQKVLELGNFEEVRNGVPIKFKVTTIPEEYIEDVIQLMNKFFLPREPLCTYFKFTEHPDAVLSFNNFWRSFIKKGASLVAIREGLEDERKRIIGANITFVQEKGVEDDIKTGDLFEQVTSYVMEMEKKVDIFQIYNVTKQLTAMGLSVDAEFHGYRVGERLLECRRPLCQALGITVSSTIFTSPISAHLAEKVGFRPLLVEEFKDFRYKGERVFENLKGSYSYSAQEYK